MSKTTINYVQRKQPDGTQLGYSLNFWIGCTPIARSCQACYAAGVAEARGWAKFGQGKARHKTKTHELAPRWNRKAAKEGFVPLVLVNNLSDFFDEEVPDEWRHEAFATMIKADCLDFLILTKRPAKMRDFMKAHFPEGLPNLWLGVSVSTDAELNAAVLDLFATNPARRVIAAMPLLGELKSLHSILEAGGIDWVLCAGESEQEMPQPDGTTKAQEGKACRLEWILGIDSDCWRQGVPFFFAGWGQWAPVQAFERQDPQAAAMCRKGIVESVGGEAIESRLFKVGAKIAGSDIPHTGGWANQHAKPTPRKIAPHTVSKEEI